MFCSREFEQLTAVVPEFSKQLHDTFDPDNNNGDYFISDGRLKISISSDFGTRHMETTYYQKRGDVPNIWNIVETNNAVILNK